MSTQRATSHREPARLPRLIWVAMGQWANRPAWCMITLAVVTLGLMASVLIFMPAPRARVHDEFGYLLAADTFAQGRLTNPTHPMADHFEAPQIIQRPTYMAKFPPMQGLWMAAGQVVTGRPIFGVYLSGAAMVAGLYWALAGAMPRRWALIGALMAMFGVAMSTYWSREYWGGFVAAFAAAVACGAAARIVFGTHRSHAAPRSASRQVVLAVVCAAAAMMLFMSRPYEGATLLVPVAVTLLLWLTRQRGPALRAAALQVVAPGLLVTAIGMAWLGYYNHQATGRATLLPYVVHDQQYRYQRFFPWQTPRPRPTGVAPELIDMQIDYGDDFPKGPAPLLAWMASKIGKQCVKMAPFVWPWTWALVLALTPWAVGVNRRSAWMIGCGAFAFLASAPSRFFFHHYLAPCVVAMVVLQAQSLRRLSVVRVRGVRAGQWAVLLLLTGLAGWAGLSLVRHVRHTEFRYWHHQRAEMINRLVAQGGRHLVIVRNPPDWNKNQYWVYNGADIDGSAVILARNISPERNDALVRHFADRQAWYCDVPSTVKSPLAPPVLTAYQPVTSP